MHIVMNVMMCFLQNSFPFSLVMSLLVRSAFGISLYFGHVIDLGYAMSIYDAESPH